MNHPHAPILVSAVLEMLAPAPGRLFVDGTLGAGGHTEALLKAGADVIGLDRDNEAVAYASRRLNAWVKHSPGATGATLSVQKANFRNIFDVLKIRSIRHIDGLLLDLGISSIQLDTGDRGFSFQNDGPLDMRMDRDGGPSVADLVNTLDQRDLSNLIHDLGDEPRDVSNRIAAAIMRYRQTCSITNTGQLAALVERALPRRGKRHPATQLFQALRIAINDEIGALAVILNAIPRILNSGGRLAIISFHSLEDRLVKRFFHNTARHGNRGQSPSEGRRDRDPCFQELTSGPVAPSPYEQEINPRARSARLRAYERI